MKSWEVLNHTADLCLRGKGETPSEALWALCEGFISELSENRGRPLQTRLIEVSGQDTASVVVSFFGELIYLALGEGWVPAKVLEASLSETGARAEVAGEPFDPARHNLHEIKAATYHGLTLEKTGENRYELTVLFDV